MLLPWFRDSLLLQDVRGLELLFCRYGADCFSDVLAGILFGTLLSEVVSICRVGGFEESEAMIISWTKMIMEVKVIQK